ncbi:hypothetical protein DFP72DRAFT_1175585 [Ephemerocybe angulata]|uniref:Uncharacterized protein n=1 Tax=Ephemerocybe angulata TaxID=980116 RepID=A0A8H6HG79_9AGAR|nr:hypothetical protein DFP72DRAFT_1175585 [Tulosesus angulatus]
MGGRYSAIGQRRQSSTPHLLGMREERRCRMQLRWPQASVDSVVLLSYGLFPTPVVTAQGDYRSEHHGFISTYHLLHVKATIPPLHDILPVLKPSAQPLSPLLLITEDVDGTDSKQEGRTGLNRWARGGGECRKGRTRSRRGTSRSARPLRIGISSALPRSPKENGDTNVANLIAQAMEKVGKKGVTTLMEWRTIEDDVEIIEGMHFDLR